MGSVSSEFNPGSVSLSPKPCFNGMNTTLSSYRITSLEIDKCLAGEGHKPFLEEEEQIAWPNIRFAELRMPRASRLLYAAFSLIEEIWIGCPPHFNCLNRRLVSESSQRRGQSQRSSHQYVECYAQDDIGARREIHCRLRPGDGP